MMKIKVLIVEPEKAPRLAYIKNELEAMQDVVGGLIQPVKPVEFKDDAVIVCNEEGKLLGLQPNVYLCYENGAPYDYVCGTFFICRAPADSEDFESLTDEQINDYFWKYA